ncbi:MAG: redoxin domain-containing protein [Trichloromonas sp.]|jgi:peroxiredoxin Q/BCP|nr:redoxin domain-containing protein [Trichloromonas sp.]
MEGHQRNLELYDRFNARVAGVSRNDVNTLKFWSDELELTFPILANPVGHIGMWFGALPPGYPMFSRKTVIIDRQGVIRYMRNGTPDFHDILRTLKKLNAEEVKS